MISTLKWVKETQIIKDKLFSFWVIDQAIPI